MCRSKLLGLLSLIFFQSCYTTINYDVQSVCEATDHHNYVVKWEVSPAIDEGKVEIFTSRNPDDFNQYQSLGKVDVKEGYTTVITRGNVSPRYFMLKFDNGVTSVAGMRHIQIDGVNNFRDIGGYRGYENRPIKWGKIYRSGTIDSISRRGARSLKALSIENCIDLRQDIYHTPYSDSVRLALGMSDYYNIAINNHRDNPYPMLIQNKFKKGDAVLLMQDSFYNMVMLSKSSIKELFSKLIQPESYPIALVCEFGILQSSMAVSLIMHALDVPEHTIVEDYLLSNQYFNAGWLKKKQLLTGDEVQEAILAMCLSNERYLEAAHSAIRRRYGTIDSFLESELGVDDEYRCKLRTMLLENY